MGIRTSILALVVFASPALAGVIEGRVIEVPDGASLTVLSREGASIHRIRLAGIDAPGKERALAGRSRESLRRIAGGKSVRVETSTIDPRGLLVGIVLIHRNPAECRSKPCPEVFDPAVSQLSAGLAVINEPLLAQQITEARHVYATAQAKARAARLGLWREGFSNSAETSR